MGQDPIAVDPGHYEVVHEDDKVRVLRIRYGPHEKSVMHGHPQSVGVFLTDAHVRFTFPDGGTEEAQAGAGDVAAHPAGEHLPENLSDRELRVVLVELKG